MTIGRGGVTDRGMGPRPYNLGKYVKIAMLGNQHS